VSRNRASSGHRRRAVLLTVALCAAATLLVAGPAAAAGQRSSAQCSAANHAKKAIHSKGRKAKKRKGKRCVPLPTPGASSSAPASSGSGSTDTPPPADDSRGCVSGIPKDSGGSWQCTFFDDFDGSSLDGGKWLTQRTDGSGFGDGTSCFVDSPNNVSVSNGTLKLTSRKEAAPFTCDNPLGDFTTRYTSGMVSTWGRFSQTYGRFEVRAKLSAAAVKGLQSSLWLWPVDATHYGPRPASGEIDFAEMYSAYPDRAIPYIHYDPASPDPNVTNTNCLISNLAAFHKYAVEWTPSSIKIVYDGRTCLTDRWNPAAPLTRPQPFDQPFLIALTQGLGIGNNAFDPGTTPLPATTEVDYVRAWI
jgi:beta-glucanase (GH16 family)